MEMHIKGEYIPNNDFYYIGNVIHSPSVIFFQNNKLQLKSNEFD